MADLRTLLVDLGYEDVVTLLQSGNVLVSSSERPVVGPIESAIASGTGVKSKVVVLSVTEFAVIAAPNPLLAVSDDLSKMVITFLDADIVPAEVNRPSDADLAPERLVITPRAIYQWCPQGHPAVATHARLVAPVRPSRYDSQRANRQPHPRHRRYCIAARRCVTRAAFIEGVK